MLCMLSLLSTLYKMYIYIYIAYAVYAVPAVYAVHPVCELCCIRCVCCICCISCICCICYICCRCCPRRLVYRLYMLYPCIYRYLAYMGLGRYTRICTVRNRPVLRGICLCCRACIAYRANTGIPPRDRDNHLTPDMGLAPTYRPRACGRLYTRARA